MIFLQEARFIQDTKDRVEGLCATLKNFTNEKPIAQLAFIVDLKNKFDNCVVGESEAVPV